MGGYAYRLFSALSPNPTVAYGYACHHFLVAAYVPVVARLTGVSTRHLSQIMNRHTTPFRQSYRDCTGCSYAGPGRNC